MRSRLPSCGSRRRNLTNSGHGLPNSTPKPGTAKWKMTSLRDAWMRLLTKPSMICGLAVVPIGEAPGQPRVWACYRQLPHDIGRLADESYELLRRDPKPPSF